MSGIFLRWGVPALLTVVGGTALALSTTTGAMTEALAARASEAVVDGGWTSVSFESRDALLTGTAPSQESIDEAAARVAAVHGVRSVRTEMVIAERADPFPFAATLADGSVALSGGLPAESLRGQIADLAGADASRLSLMAGAPPRDSWLPAVTFGLGFLEHFDEGEVVLAGLDLTVHGRAKSSESFDALARRSAEVPNGVTIAALDIVPPLASPFTWRATFDGSKLAMSGFTPSEDFLDSIQSAPIAGHPVSTSLVLASGASEDFEVVARTLLENLVLLEDGTAEISGDTAALSGAPPDVATAERVRSAMTRIGAGFDLAPPRVAAYTFIAERQGEGMAFTGHVPDNALLQRLGELDGADVAGLELARGAPERFESAVEFGLDLLSRLSEGRFVIDGASLSITGRAATLSDFDEVETALSLGAPQGLILAHADVRPPLADPFTWSATKAVGEGIALSGYVPSKAARERLKTAAIEVKSDSTIVADGSPANFEAEAGLALGILQLLDAGQVAYDGAGWALAGSVATAEAAVAADRAFAESGLRAAGWTFDLDAPAPEPPPPPVIDPYVWTAEKAVTGTISIAGFVPTDELKRMLAARAGAGAADESALGSGEPDGFIPDALAGIDALVRLRFGTVHFDGTQWSLSGEVSTENERLAVEESLQAAVDTSGWRIAVQAEDAAPVVSDYVWSATKSSDGHLALSGYVADEELRQFIIVRAGEGATDSTEVASGAPAGFIADVLAGLEALGHLAEGSASLEAGSWTLSGLPKSPEDAELALAALGSTDATRWTTDLADPVESPVPPAVEEPAPPPVVRDYAFVATKPLAGPIVLEGAVPTTGAADYLVALADSDPATELTMADSLPRNFVVNATVGIRMLRQLSSGEFGLEGEQWLLTGSVENEADREAVLQQVGASPTGAGWQTSVTLMQPLDSCRRRVAAFASRNAILFQSGSARLAEESNAAIDELAGYLKLCPDATVHVEGHTDADGADDLNLALSVARAETVVDALIARGVAFQRLYAVGYGESLPIADNDTSAGKRANRRIAFAILEEHE